MSNKKKEKKGKNPNESKLQHLARKGIMSKCFLLEKTVDKFGFRLIKYSGKLWKVWGVKSLESCLKAKEYWGMNFWYGSSTFSFDPQIIFSNLNIYLKQNLRLFLLSSCEVVDQMFPSVSLSSPKEHAKILSERFGPFMHNWRIEVVWEVQPGLMALSSM